MKPSETLLHALSAFLAVDHATEQPYFRIGAKDCIESWLDTSPVQVQQLAAFLLAEKDRHAVHSLFVFSKDPNGSMGPVGATIIDGARQFSGWGYTIKEAIADAQERAFWTHEREDQMRLDMQDNEREARSCESVREETANVHD